MNKNLNPVMIAAISRAVPKTVITNEDLTKILDTSDEWITTRTGIKERRVVSGEENSIDLGIEAAQKALAKAKMSGEEIDLIITASSVPARVYPSPACEIQKVIGAKKALAFNITAACTGLIYAMKIAQSFISTGEYENVLLVATDANSKFVDWTDRSTCVLFGDGAGAMILKKSPDGVNDIVNLEAYTDGSIWEHIQMPITGKNCPLVEPNEVLPEHVAMNGKEVYKFVVQTMPEDVNNCIAKAGLTPEDIDYLVPHQANLRIISAIQERLGYSDEKVITNIDKYGNTSAASIPIALTEAVEQGKMKLPCKAVLCGFGAGMTWGSAVVRLRDGVA